MGGGPDSPGRAAPLTQPVAPHRPRGTHDGNAAGTGACGLDSPRATAATALRRPGPRRRRRPVYPLRPQQSRWWLFTVAPKRAGNPSVLPAVLPAGQGCWLATGFARLRMMMLGAGSSCRPCCRRGPPLDSSSWAVYSPHHQPRPCRPSSQAEAGQLPTPKKMALFPNRRAEWLT